MIPLISDVEYGKLNRNVIGKVSVAYAGTYCRFKKNFQTEESSGSFSGGQKGTIVNIKSGKTGLLAAALLAAALLAGCGKDAKLDKFHTEMEDFTRQANETFDVLANIDPESDTAVEDMLSALDELAAEFNLLAEIEVPRQFSAVENLADEAGENMTQAANLYREAYGEEEYNENVAAAAAEYYHRAVKRLTYISEILQGEMPTDDSIVITTENDAPGFKEDADEGAQTDDAGSGGEDDSPDAE